LGEVSPPPTCHLSSVMCHMSHGTCRVSYVSLKKKYIGQSGEASRWRVCYQRGLPRLVLTCALFTSIKVGPGYLLVADSYYRSVIIQALFITVI
jgi:hypothetical protein